MDSSKQIVYEVITGYTGKALNGYSYLTQDEEHTLLTVVDVAQSKEKSEPHYVGVSVIVRIMGDMVIIDRDQNDKLVIDALVQAGIPREQIILAYAGESVPEVTV
ncbi:MAG: XisI protein [Chloroflexi bacterium]|nr:XisI protein [Chloroflexota bacterium]